MIIQKAKSCADPYVNNNIYYFFTYKILYFNIYIIFTFYKKIYFIYKNFVRR